MGCILSLEINRHSKNCSFKIMINPYYKIMVRGKPTYEKWWFGFQGYAFALCSSYERKLEVLRSLDLCAVGNNGFERQHNSDMTPHKILVGWLGFF